jgi:soluble lytic murein transglycosylase-like protein
MKLPLRRSAKFGLLLSGNKIWFSELLAGTLFVFFLSTFLFVTTEILLNFHAIHANDRRITALQTEKITLDHTIDEARREAKIVALLRSFAGNAVPDTTLCNVGSLVSRNSAQFGYDPLLLLAVIRVESYFFPNLYGHFQNGQLSGAIGLMQLQIEPARFIAGKLNMGPIHEKDLLNPEINLVLGTAFLLQLISDFKSFKLGLLAYNLGPGAVSYSISNRQALPLEYYRRVLQSYDELQRLAAKSSP